MLPVRPFGGGGLFNLVIKLHTNMHTYGRTDGDDDSPRPDKSGLLLLFPLPDAHMFKLAWPNQTSESQRPLLPLPVRPLSGMLM